MIAFSRGGWGWLVIGVVLLFPLFWLWNWWQGMNARRFDALPRKTPPSAFSGTASPANMTPGVGPTTTLASAKLPIGLPAATANAAEKASSPKQKVGDPPALTASASPVLAAGAGTRVSLPNPMKEDVPGYSPKVDRDPTLSPPDVIRLQNHTTVAVKAAPRTSIESRIHLSGIIVTPRGINAIVNSERVVKGDDVQGARVVRITPNCVDFEYHEQGGKRKVFSQCIQ